MKTPLRVREQSLEVAMTPMIDVVFLLLVFFLWTSSFQVPESDLPGSVAESAANAGSASDAVEAPAEAFDEIVIGVANASTGVSIQLNRQSVSGLGDLRERIAAILELGVQPPVIVDPESEVSMADAVAVFDTARSAGAYRVLFGIEPQ